METKLSPRATRIAMNAAVVEGALYTVWFSLIGNNFLTGFMLYLGATNSQIGLTASLAPLSSLSMVFAAYIMALLPRRRPYLMGNAYAHRLLWSLAGFIPLVLPQHMWVWAFLGVYFVSNLALSLCIPAWQSIMADTVPPETRGRYFGMRSAVAQAVAVVTTLAAGYWLDRHPGYEGFRGLYLAAIFFGLINVSSFFWQQEPPYVRRKPESITHHLRLPFVRPSFRHGALFATLLVMAGAVIIPFYPVQMIKGLDLGYGVIAQVSALATVAGVIANVLLGRVMDRIGVDRVLGIYPVAAAAVPLLWLAIGPGSMLLLYVAWALHGALQAVQMLVLQNLNFGLAPRTDRPIYLAVFSALAGLGGFVAPIVGGRLSESLPFGLLVAASVVMYAGCTALWWLNTRPHVAEALSAGEDA